MTEDVTISDVIDPLTSLSEVKNEIREHLNRHAFENHGVKWYITLHVSFVKRNNIGVMAMLRSDEYEAMYIQRIGRTNNASSYRIRAERIGMVDQPSRQNSAVNGSIQSDGWIVILQNAQDLGRQTCNRQRAKPRQ